MPLQINTLVTSFTVEDLPAIYRVVAEIGATRWALFFLIRTGRGKALQEISARHSEQVLKWLFQLSPSKETLSIKTTEAHHFRRLGYITMRKQGLSDEAILNTPFGKSFGIRDGNGIVFVSHTGDVFPSGFLPISSGNVRQKRLADLYRHSPLFQKIRDTSALKGKCGQCEFKAICGGSRARAFARFGDPLESDPLCPYRPKSFSKKEVAVQNS